MSENEQPLTPEQQQAEDSTQIRARFGATDALERFATMMDDIGFGSGSGGFFGRTDFESRRLNEMLDLVGNSNPADLERAGEALVGAKTALNRAARELSDYVNRVEWKGEAATEFRRFGNALAKHAYALATFANAAGTQMTAASTGLTSVRNSMPRERDNRQVPRTVEDFALTPAKENDPEYLEAVRVERNRQEAINQMNRLASFYAVSEESLAAQQPPAFPAALSADVPRPTVMRRGSDSQVNPAHSAGSSSDVSRPGADQGGTRATGGGSRAGEFGTVPSVTERQTAMEIDGVATPPAPTATSGGAPHSPATGSPGNPGGPHSSTPPVLAAPVQGLPPRARGTSAAPRVGGSAGGNAVGRPSATGSGAPAAGRAGVAGRTGAVGSPTTPGAQGMLGRPYGPTGTGGAAGRAGAVGASGQGPAVGRPAAAGQSPAGRTSRAPTASGRAGHSSGVIGGTPQRAVPGNAGSRTPKGTVVGAETSPHGRSPGARSNQFGAIGAGEGKAVPRTTGKGTPTVDGVLGMPRNGAQGVGSASGAVSGVKAGQRQPGRQDQEREEAARPDHLTEDEQTWKVQRRGAVPPVID
ncbi:hypothetical protein AB0I99_11130 [Streptomyces spongiicola]|uniref:hypothetical protein n=1 Tax=Streptomyces spongiicola TaxID=1690221 RepID=UPI003407C7F5